MNVTVPKEVLDETIKKLELAKLMAFGGMFSLQDLPIPLNLKRDLIKESFEISLLAGKLFAYTLPIEQIEDEISEAQELALTGRDRELKRFDKRHEANKI